jgi:hypothetical protein
VKTYNGKKQAKSEDYALLFFAQISNPNIKKESTHYGVINDIMAYITATRFSTSFVLLYYPLFCSFSTM